MANVISYNPSGSVAPSGQGTPYIRVPGAIEEASGVGVARAVQGFGKEVSQVGDMLAKHALSFQQIQNETDAKNGDVEAMVAIGQAAAKFDQLEGENSVKALPGYQQEIKDIRETALKNMPNAEARRMLDQSISRRVGFALVDAGHKAGTQLKSANKQARVARRDTALAEADPSKPGSMELNWQTIESELQHDGEEAGAKQDTINNEKRKAWNKMWLGGITKIAYTKPELAKELYDKIADKLDPEVKLQAERFVNQGMANLQTRTDAREIFDKLKITPESGEGRLQDALAEADKYIEKKGKDNPLYADGLTARIKTNYHTMVDGFRDAQHGTMNELGQFISGKSDDNRIVSMDALIGEKADPNLSQAFKSLTFRNQQMVSKWVESNAKGNFDMSPEKMKRYLEYRGMLNDENSWQKFYDMGPDAIMKENFPLAQRMELLKRQQDIGKKPVTYNNIVSRAIKDPDVSAQLLAAGIDTTPDTKAKSENYFAFRGALEDAMRDYRDTNKKDPTGKDLSAIVSKLLIKQGGGWFSSGRFNFDISGVPVEFKAQAREDLKTSGIPNPTDQQIARWYAHVMYKKAFQEQEKPKTKAPKPAVPSLNSIEGI